MLKGKMTEEEIAQCVTAARLLRDSDLGRSERQVMRGPSSWSPSEVRNHVERSDSWNKAQTEFDESVDRLRRYLRLLAEVRQDVPLAYPHLLDAMSLGNYLPGETLPSGETAPYCVFLYDPERTLLLVRAAMDGTVERIRLRTNEMKGEARFDDESESALVAAFPTMAYDVMLGPMDFLPIYVDRAWEHGVFDAFEDIRRSLDSSGYKYQIGRERLYLSWKGLYEAKASGFADLDGTFDWSRSGGVPHGPFMGAFKPEAGSDTVEKLREVGGDRLAVFTFRLPKGFGGQAIGPEAVLLHSAGEQADWRARMPIGASEDVSHGLSAVAVNFGQIDKKAYLRGDYVERAESGVRLVFGAKFS